LFDEGFAKNSGSTILKEIAGTLGGTEAEITQIQAIKTSATTVTGIQFNFQAEQYTYDYEEMAIKKITR
jgi:hypothetical protein